METMGQAIYDGVHRFTGNRPVTVVAQKAIKAAQDAGIPMVADTLESQQDGSLLQLRHYDYGKDLSVSEMQLLRQFAFIAAQACDVELRLAFHPLDLIAVPAVSTSRLSSAFVRTAGDSKPPLSSIA